MTPHFAIIEARAHFCGQMSRALRLEHQKAIATTGRDTHRELRAVFDASSFTRAWLIDGKLAAIGGVTGPILSPTGYVWLALTEQATRHPVALVKEAMRQLHEIMITKREVATTILGGDNAAKRLAIFLGFHVHHDGIGDRAFSREARRRLSEFVETKQDARVPVGRSYAIAMGYHEDTS
jgi:hypothetical protein